MRFRMTVDLPPVPDGWYEYGYSVAGDDLLAIVRTRDDVQAQYAAAIRHGAPRPGPTRARVSLFDGQGERAVIEIPFRYGMRVERFVDGRWLVVASRAKDGEANAVVYRPDGEPLSAFPVGDGVEHVRCMPDGTVWVGYFDEGIFANRRPDGSPPLSAAGLAQYLPTDGTVLYRFNDDARPELFIGECYALTADDGAVWSCSMTGWQIVRNEGPRQHAWRNEIHRSEALAVDGDHVVLAGGSGETAGRLALVRLDDERAVPVAASQLPSAVMDDLWLLRGRGATLHLVGGGVWRTLDVAAVRDALER